MNADLQRVSQQLEQARTPEEVFGDLGACGPDGADGLKQAYHRLARLTHPDSYSDLDDQRLAQAAFNRLSEWLARAHAKLDAHVYGKAGRGALEDWRVVLESRRGVYVLENDFSEDPLYLRYPAAATLDGRSLPVTLKITRDPHNNDLAANEASALQTLASGKEAAKFLPYIPRLLDSFLYNEDGLARQVNVIKHSAGWYTLEQVRKAYPDGIDPRDMAWMWRRILVALGFAHLNGILHGAVLPDNILILPEVHGLRLAEWSFSLPIAEREPGSGGAIAALDPRYAEWYPPEVLRREPAVTGTDIDMAARCMIYLLGGDPCRKTLPGSVPQPIRMFLKGCTLESKRARPQDAWALKEEFDELLHRMWGERKFHPFTMNVGG